MENPTNHLPQQNWLFNIFLYTFILGTTLIIYGYTFPSSNNLTEVPPVFALLNPKLFKHDFYVQDTLQITPRYYYQYLIYLTTKILRIDVYVTYFIYYALSLCSFIMGLYALGNKFCQSKLGGSALVFLSLSVAEGTVGYVSLFRQEPIPAIFAMGLTIWGFYFCFSKDWIKGYLFFGLACFLQFLVGFLPGILMLPLLILDAKKSNNWFKIIPPLLILGFMASLIYIPMVINGNAGSSLMSDQEFVYLYGYLRHPHHIIVSQFAVPNWRSFFLLIVSGILCIKISTSLSQEIKINFILIIITSLISLVIGYIFVEIFPIALIAKLQLARTTPFVLLIVLMVISIVIDEQYKQRNLAFCILLLITPINKNGLVLTVLVLLVLMILKIMNKRQLLRSPVVTTIAIIAGLGFLSFYPNPTYGIDILNRIIGKLLLFVVVFLPFFIEEMEVVSRLLKRLIYFLAIGIWLFLILGLVDILPTSLSQVVKSRIGNLNSQVTPQDSLTKLALKFRDQTNVDAVILTPPSLKEFRFYSQRSLVYTFYSSPYTEPGFKEWSNRLESMLGTTRPPLSYRNIDKIYSTRSSEQLVQAAQKFKANYLLTRSDWHSDVKGVIIAQEGKWVIYKLTIN